MSHREDDPPPARAALGPSSSGPAFRRIRVLVVDDDDGTRSAMKRWLGERYDVTLARDGQEGLETALSSEPDAIVTDLSMPRLDGLGMVRRLRELQTDRPVPVVFLTVSAEPEDLLAGASLGGVSYLLKPVDLRLLEQEIDRAVRTGVADDAPPSARDRDPAPR